MGKNNSLISNWGYPQVSGMHYLSQEYLSQARFLGLHAQLQACLELGEENQFLEIGPGPGLLTVLLRYFGYQVLTLDFANDVKSNIQGKLPELPFENKSFDVICAFEVLEHIPFELLGICLREMRRVARKRIIISVPDQQELHGKRIKLFVRISRWAYERSWWHIPFGRLTNPDQHFWEVGYDGILPQTVIDIAVCESLIPVSAHFVNPWFHYFIFNVN